MNGLHPRLSFRSAILGVALAFAARRADAAAVVTASSANPGPTPYGTLRAAFDAINTGVHQGSILIVISTNLDEGSTPATLNRSGSGAASYSMVQIRPGAFNRTIMGSPGAGFGVIQLRGAENVRIDGHFLDSGDQTTRDLTITNNSSPTAVGSSVIRIATSTDFPSADNNIIANCILNGNVTSGNSPALTSTAGSQDISFGVYVGGEAGGAAMAPITSATGAPAAAGTTVNGLVVSNNWINRCGRGVVFNGAATSVAVNVAIQDNFIGDAGSVTGSPPYATPATTVYTKGIWVAGVASANVLRNQVKNIVSYVGAAGDHSDAIEITDPIGAGFSQIESNTITTVANNGTLAGVRAISTELSQASSSCSVRGNTITNLQTRSSAAAMGIHLGGSPTGLIAINTLTTIYARGSGGAAFGIDVAGGNGIAIANNAVTDLSAVLGGGLSFDRGVFGLRLAGGANHRVHHNSIHLAGSFLGGAATAGSSAAFAITDPAVTNADVRNNAFANTLLGAFSGSSTAAIMLPSGAPSAMGLNLNNNAYYQGMGGGAEIGQVGVAGLSGYSAAAFDPSTTAGASNLRSYTSQLGTPGNDDASYASAGVLPFMTSTDVHVAQGTFTWLESHGAPGTGVIVDIDGTPRPGPPGSLYGGASASDVGAHEFDGFWKSEPHVIVTATAGTLGPSPYVSIGAAFGAINGGVHRGAIVVAIVGDVSEGAAPATLNSSGAGAASYTSVLIQPTIDGARVFGGPPAGYGVIQLNGADHVTIDGDNPNTLGVHRDLTITNTTLSTLPSPRNSVIRIATSPGAVTSADDDKIRNCVIKGNVLNGNTGIFNASLTPGDVSYGVFAGGNGGANPTSAPTALTVGTGEPALAGTTIHSLVVDNNEINQCARAVVFASDVNAGVSSLVTVTNNVIGTAQALQGAAPYAAPLTTVYGVGVSITGPQSAIVRGNVIQNIMSWVPSTKYGVFVQAGPGSIAVEGNVISGVVTNNVSSNALGISLQSVGATTIMADNNTIETVETARGGSAVGIQYAGSTAGTIRDNRIVSVKSRLNQTPSVGYGVNVTTGESVRIENNSIADVNAYQMAGALSFADGTFGIRLAGGHAHLVQHNSVHLSGAFVGGSAAAASAALAITSASITDVVAVNNALANRLTGGRPGSVAVDVMLPSGANAGMNLTIGHNAYFEGAGTGAGIAQVGTTAGIGLYRASAFDASSDVGSANLRAYTNTLSPISGNDERSFASLAPAPFVGAVDLHVAAGTLTKLESGGRPGTGIDHDFDGEARPGPPGSVNGGGTANDIGADEFDGRRPLDNDVRAVAILSPTSVVHDVVFVPTASFENEGVAKQQNVPVRYKMSGPLPSTASVYDEVTSIGSLLPEATATATFPSLSLPAGIYSVVVTAENPGDGDPANDQVSGTLEIAGALCGIYEVGATEPFPFNSLSNAVDRLNLVGVTCAVSFYLVDPVYSRGERFPIVIRSVIGGSATNTVKIRPSPTLGGPLPDQLINGVGQPAIIVLDGADYVTIDGSRGNDGSRQLTILNQTPLFNTAVVWGRTTTSGDPATHNTVKNLNLSGTGITLPSFVGAGFGGTAVGTPGKDNDGNRIENNFISRVQVGVYSAGESAANKNMGTVITRNAMTSLAPENVQGAGVLANFEDGIQITDNTIANVGRPQAAMGISLGLGLGGNILLITSPLEVTNATISGNRIGPVASTATFGLTAAGIAVGAASSGTTRITNNLVTGVVSPANPDDGTLGIYVGGGQATTEVLHNSVNLTGARGTAANPSYALAIGGANPVVAVRDNILVNAQTSAGAGKSFALGLNYASYSNLTTDYNDLVTAGGSAGFVRTGGLSDGPGHLLLTAVEFPTLAAWQAESGQEANSISADPLFVGPGDLHIDNTGAVTSPVANRGANVGVAVDVDGEPRSATPDIGADEFTTYGLALTIVGNGAVAQGPLFTSYNPNASVQLTPTADPNWAFGGWSGDASGFDDPLKVAMDAEKSITATFTFPTAVQLSLFEANTVNDGVELRWRFADPSELAAVWLERSPTEAGPWTRLELATLALGETSSAIDRDVEAGRLYHYRLVARLAAGETQTFSAIEGRAGDLVRDFGLERVVPNPAPAAALIRYALPREASIRLSVVDIQGRTVATLVDGSRPAGRHEVVWAREMRFERAPAGLYFVRLEAPDRVLVKRFVLQ